MKLSPLGLERLLPWIIKGKLKNGLKRRSCNNRKLTDMSVGTIVGMKSASGHCCTVKWDMMVTEMSIAKRFLRRTLRVIES